MIFNFLLNYVLLFRRQHTWGYQAGAPRIRPRIRHGTMHLRADVRGYSTIPTFGFGIPATAMPPSGCLFFFRWPCFVQGNRYVPSPFVEVSPLVAVPIRLHLASWGAYSRVPASTRGLGGSLSYTKSMWGCKLDGLLIWMMWVLAWIEVCLVVYYREEVKNKKILTIFRKYERH
jgi:hypothetical protein